MSNPDDGGARVELVDRAGRTIGPLGKLYAHLAPGRLHRAISVFLLDRPDRWLVQRRAVGKCHGAAPVEQHVLWPSAPGRTAERRRADGWLRTSASSSSRMTWSMLAPFDAGTVMYEIADRASRLLEREYDNLFAGRVTDHPQLNEAEVAEITAVSLAGLTSVTPDGSRFTAWLPIVLRAVYTPSRPWPHPEVHLGAPAGRGRPLRLVGVRTLNRGLRLDSSGSQLRRAAWSVEAVRPRYHA